HGDVSDVRRVPCVRPHGIGGAGGVQRTQRRRPTRQVRADGREDPPVARRALRFSNARCGRRAADDVGGGGGWAEKQCRSAARARQLERARPRDGGRVRAEATGDSGRDLTLAGVLPGDPRVHTLVSGENAIRFVAPAEAGGQAYASLARRVFAWIPAYAGTTMV